MNAVGQTVGKISACLFGWCCCFKASPSPSRDKSLFAHVYPSISQDTRLSFSNVNDMHFLHVSLQSDVDKTVNYFKEVNTISESDALQISNTLSNLKQLRASYATGKQTAKEKVLNETQSEATNIEIMRLPFGQQQADGELPTKHRLIIEIQKGKFFWPEEARGLHGSYVQIKIVSIDAGKSNVSSPGLETKQLYQTLHTFETTSADNLLNPVWNEVFKQDINEQWTLQKIAFKVKLYYKKKKGNELVQIGGEQTFFLKELEDQQVRLKEVSFKSERSMGLIAKVGMRVQYVHDADKARTEVLQKIDYRIEQLTKIKNTHRETFKNANRNSIYKAGDSYCDRSIDLAVRKNSSYHSSAGSLTFESNFYVT